MIEEIFHKERPSFDVFAACNYCKECNISVCPTLFRLSIEGTKFTFKPFKKPISLKEWKNE